MPINENTEPSNFAGKGPEFEKQEIAETVEGKTVIVFHYDKAKGVYIVADMVDRPGVHSPAYAINPDKLKKIKRKDN